MRYSWIAAAAIGCLLGISHADLAAQSNVYTVPLTQAAPDDGPRPDFSPTGTRVPLQEVVPGEALPPGAVHPARRGMIQVGPTRESWIPILLTASADQPGAFTRLYVDTNRNGDFSDDGPPALATLQRFEGQGLARSAFGESELPVWFPEAERTEGIVASFWQIHWDANPEPDDFIQYSIRTFWRTGSVTVNGVPALVAVMDRNNDLLYGPGDSWSVVQASMPEASQRVLSREEARGTDRLMFLERGADAADLVLEFRSFARDGSSITFAVVDHPISKAEDRVADNVAAVEWSRPRATTPYSWIEDLDGAIAAARASGKRVFLYFEAEWCGPCHIMDQWIWTDAEVVEALEAGFVGVKLDGDIEKDHVQRYEVKGYPTILIVDPASSMVISSVVGYQSSQDLLDFLRGAGE